MDPRAGASARPAARHGPRSAAPSPPPAVEAAPPAGTPDRVREGCAARSRADPAGEASLCCAPWGGSVELERSLSARGEEARRGGGNRNREGRRRRQERRRLASRCWRQRFLRGRRNDCARCKTRNASRILPILVGDSLTFTRPVPTCATAYSTFPFPLESSLT